jgi:hypothetical protein
MPHPIRNSHRIGSRVDAAREKIYVRHTPTLRGLR